MNEPEPINETNEPEDMEPVILSRREMIAMMVGSGISVAAAVVLAGPLAPVVEQMATSLMRQPPADDPTTPKWGMVIDLNRCIGCEYCVYACQATNDTTEDMRWNIIVEDETETGHQFFVTRPCLHCQNAPCVSVCPVAATRYREDGLVIMDYDRCIGCRYCQAACPYGARVFNWGPRGDEPNPYVPEWGNPEIERRDRGVVEKCTFCIHRIDAGVPRGLVPGVDREATPACVNACPVDARFFGNLRDPNSPVSQIIASTPTMRLREDLGTDAHVYYIPPGGLS